MMIRVLDEARSVSFYDKAFGLKVAERVDFPDFTLAYLSNAETPFEVELPGPCPTSRPAATASGGGSRDPGFRKLHKNRHRIPTTSDD